MSKLRIEAFGALKARALDIENVLVQLSELSRPMNMSGNEIRRLRELSKELVSLAHEFDAYRNAYHTVLNGEKE